MDQSALVSMLTSLDVFATHSVDNFSYTHKSIKVSLMPKWSYKLYLCLEIVVRKGQTCLSAVVVEQASESVVKLRFCWVAVISNQMRVILNAKR